MLLKLKRTGLEKGVVVNEKNTHHISFVVFIYKFKLN